jgi:hypothetical protein
MERLRWPVGLIVAFIIGLGLGGRSPAGRDADPETVTRLRQQVDMLQARLRAREDLASTHASRAGADGAPAPARAADAARWPALPPLDDGAALAAVPASTTARDRTSAAAAASRTKTAPATVDGALDRFYRYLEAISESGGPPRWREARELLGELRGMGEIAGQALMQVLETGTTSDERRAAARLLGRLGVAEALPLLRDVVERDTDVLLRRAAASGMRQLQTPEAIPVMERILAQPAEDRYVRLSAAAGLAQSGRAAGVTGLVNIFEESAADGRGREMAFRALAGLEDDRPVPFMRQLVTSQAEPGYRLRAIRYLSAQGDEQALAALHVLMHSPNEQPSIRDAAAQAYAVITRK